MMKNSMCCIEMQFFFQNIFKLRLVESSDMKPKYGGSGLMASSFST
jgi:hypothetical protein